MKTYSYNGGKLQQAITRGREGIIGEDVTHTVRTFLNVPLTVPATEPFEVRGEGVISWENFEKINAGLNEAYTHPRNLAAGSVRKLDPAESKKRMLEFWAFDLVTDLQFATKAEQFAFLEKNGFCVVPHSLLIDPDKRGMNLAVVEMNPANFAYPVDGLIMEYNDVAYGKSLGATGHHENRLIALKWKDELFETKFLGVELATTRTGMVSLTGLFEPVEMDGATVSRAYLHNLDIFDSFQFGVGDTIQVYKANMIIPQIADNKTQSNTYTLPKTCPCCGSLLTVETTSGGTRQLFCKNPHCTAKLVQRFTHLESAVSAWGMAGYHKAAYEIHAERCRKISRKYADAMGYDYDKALERCRRRRARDGDTGMDGLEALVRRRGDKQN